MEVDADADTLSCSSTASSCLSFSHDLSYSDTSPPDHPPLRPYSASSDFHFKPTAVFPLPDPSPADFLFSDGKLLPSPLLVNHATTINLRQLLDSTKEEDNPTTTKGRSSRSLSCRPARSPTSGSGYRRQSPLVRSKSAGWNPALLRNITRRRGVGMGYGHGDGVRPILNVDITSSVSVLSCFLCSCGDKSAKVEG